MTLTYRLLLYTPGTKLPADMIVLESNGIKVDNSNLTGESEPQKRGTEMTHESPFQSRCGIYGIKWIVNTNSYACY
jgi:magnesium-transporting ATPase (P-type)